MLHFCSQFREGFIVLVCGNSSVVERLLAKEKVAGSIPVFRSTNTLNKQLSVFVCCKKENVFTLRLIFFLTNDSISLYAKNFYDYEQATAYDSFADISRFGAQGRTEGFNRGQGRDCCRK